MGKQLSGVGEDCLAGFLAAVEGQLQLIDALFGDFVHVFTRKCPTLPRRSLLQNSRQSARGESTAEPAELLEAGAAGGRRGVGSHSSIVICK